MTGAVPDPLPDWLTGADADLRPHRRRASPPTAASPTTAARTGVWTRDPDAEKLVTLSYYVADPEIRRRAWRMRAGARRSPTSAAQRRARGPGRPRAAGPAARADHARTSTGCTRRPGRRRTACSRSTDGARGRVPVLLTTGRRCAARWTGSTPASPTRVPALRRHPEVGDRQLRSGAGRRPRWPRAAAAAADCDVFLAAGTSLQVWPVAGLAEIAACARGPRDHRQRRADPVRRRSPTSSSASRSARRCRGCWRRRADSRARSRCRDGCRDALA